MHASIAAIEYHLPERVLTTANLAAEFPEWSVEKIDQKTGISERHIAARGECSSDLAVAAAQKLFAGGRCRAEKIDYVLLCTQSPDYFLPTTACLVQDRLGIPTWAGALDFNLGCSGYIYGLGLAEGLIATGQAQSILLLTAETYSKFLEPEDKSVRTIFGDAAAATWVRAVAEPSIGPFVYGTDGKGGEHLIVRKGGLRSLDGGNVRDAGGLFDNARNAGGLFDNARNAGGLFDNARNAGGLFMDGAEIFNFTLSAVPESIQALLEKSGVALEAVDLFVFHQANRYMLEHLRKRLKIAPEKFQISMAECGNTVSSTIPIALWHAAKEGRLRSGQLVMLVGFGVGLSWGATLVRWV